MRITGALHEDQCTFVIISRSVLLRLRNISDESCRERNKNTHFTFNSNFFWARSKNCEKRLLASSCLSFRIDHFGSHWTDFHEIVNLSIFRKSVEQTKVSLKSNKNNRYFTRRPVYIYDHISLRSY